MAHRAGNAADGTQRERAYSSDLNRQQWRVVRKLIPVPAWLRGRGGRPEGYCHRVMIDAVLYLVNNGIKWTEMPVDFPPWKAVYRFFRRWQGCGFLDILHDALRELARKAAGKKPRPTAAIVDSQSVKASWHVAAESRGYDGGKNVSGRKRHLVVDTLGLLLVVCVTTAGLQDRDVAVPLLTRLRRGFATVKKVWADGGYTGSLVEWARTKLGLDVDIVRRPDEARGFVLLKRRWIVERTLAWLVNSRRLTRDYEYLPAVHEAMVKWTMIRIMVRRVATAGT
ncbi:IS5 family transposase [Streptomyces sp. M2CJ-2]|uniref:IS5 family transposase n=1 Tax=Streptomyces sp. M2CJ-2 TaxID=2803948 RepID=UPI001F01A317|nr:IS5 family transposase [Streptomyces sp. M2CJ-2]